MAHKVISGYRVVIIIFKNSTYIPKIHPETILIELVFDHSNVTPIIAHRINKQSKACGFIRIYLFYFFLLNTFVRKIIFLLETL